MVPTRVVTAVGPDGRSIVVERGSVQPLSPLPGLELAELWSCDDVGPGMLSVRTAPTEFSPAPPPGGALFRLVEFPPDPIGQMHSTDTVDLITVISGELVLVLDGGEEVVVGPGETVVQHAAGHAWRNLGTDPAVASVVMLGAGA